MYRSVSEGIRCNRCLPAAAGSVPACRPLVVPVPTVAPHHQVSQSVTLQLLALCAYLYREIVLLNQASPRRSFQRNTRRRLQEHKRGLWHQLQSATLVCRAEQNE